METLSRDEEYIIRKTGIGDVLSESRRKTINPAKGAPTTQVLEKYFSQLSRDQMNAIYKIYRIDFDMFGYDVNKYFKMITH
jgi:hypothetical protein